MATEDVLSWLDYLVFAALLSISMGVGVFFTCTQGRQNTNAEFLLADRQLRILPTTLSMLMTYLSAVHLLGNAAEMYTYGIQLYLTAIGLSLTHVLAAFTIIPLFYPLKLTSIFEYLELRFQSRGLRQLGTVLDLITMSMWTGISLFAPCIALSAVTPIKWWVSLLVSGFIGTFYTSIGGLKAVVWADALQALCFFGGIITILVLGVLKVGGLDTMWETSLAGGRLHLDWSPDSTLRVSVWSAVLGYSVYGFMQVGFRQTAIQRYSAMRSINAAIIASMLKGGLVLVAFLLPYLIGMAVYTYYEQQGCDPLRSGDISSSNQLVSYFVVAVIGVPGVSGLFVATLFSGSLSSLSSSVSGNTAITWKDFLEPRFAHLSLRSQAAICKLISLFHGMLSTGLGFVFYYVPGHVMEVGMSMCNSTNSPILGMFILGTCFPQSNAKGTLVGVICGFAIHFSVSLGNVLYHPWPLSLNTTVTNCSANTTISDTSLMGNPATPWFFSTSFLWFTPLGAVTTITVGLVVSIVIGGQPSNSIDQKLILPVLRKLWRNNKSIRQGAPEKAADVPQIDSTQSDFEVSKDTTYM